MANGVQLAVLSSRLETIARKMANTLFRTARSGLINCARDLSCCILTADHELLAEAESLPSHVLVGPDADAGVAIPSSGRTVLEGPAADLEHDPQVQAIYLGVAASP